MHLYLRLLTKDLGSGHTAAEQQRIRQLLLPAPGVNIIKAIEPHVKGGYAATLDVSGEYLDALIEHIEQSSYMLVF